MKFTCLICLLVFAIQVPAQKKLKMEISKSGDTSWSTKDDRIYNSPGGRNAVGDYLKTSVYKSKNGFLLVLSIQTGRTNMLQVEEGAAAEIMFTDGNAISLSNTSYQESKKTMTDYGCFIFTFYRLGSSALNDLRNYNLSRISIPSSSGKLIYNIKEKDSDAIRKQLALF